MLDFRSERERKKKRLSQLPLSAASLQRREGQPCSVENRPHRVDVEHRHPTPFAESERVRGGQRSSPRRAVLPGRRASAPPDLAMADRAPTSRKKKKVNFNSPAYTSISTSLSPAPAKTSSRSCTEETETMLGRGSCFFHQEIFTGASFSTAAAAAAAPGASTAVVASVLEDEDEEGEGAVGAWGAEAEEARALLEGGGKREEVLSFFAVGSKSRGVFCCCSSPPDTEREQRAHPTPANAASVALFQQPTLVEDQIAVIDSNLIDELKGRRFLARRGA